jgi:hypothetical protein
MLRMQGLNPLGRLAVCAEQGGGEGGIRTPDRLAPMPHFECGAFNRSATSPNRYFAGRRAAVMRADVSSHVLDPKRLDETSWAFSEILRHASGPAQIAPAPPPYKPGPRDRWLCLRLNPRLRRGRIADFRASARRGRDGENRWRSASGRAASAAESPAGSDRAR